MLRAPHKMNQNVSRPRSARLSAPPREKSWLWPCIPNAMFLCVRAPGDCFEQSGDLSKIILNEARCVPPIHYNIQDEGAAPIPDQNRKYSICHVITLYGIVTWLPDMVLSRDYILNDSVTWLPNMVVWSVTWLPNIISPFLNPSSQDEGAVPIPTQNRKSGKIYDIWGSAAPSQPKKQIDPCLPEPAKIPTGYKIAG